MFKFKCCDTFRNLPEEAAKHIINASDNCAFVAEADTKPELIKKVVEHATEVHGLENRRLAPAVLMESVQKHIIMED